MLECGIVGLPNVGKSTLFNALLKKQVAQSANYPFTTIEPNIGVVEVPDERLEKLAGVIAKEGDSISGESRIQNDMRSWVNGRPPIIPAAVKFVDIAGLVKGAAQGEGLGNQFLAHIREVDVVVFVLRDFANEEVIRSGSTTPEEDLEVLKSELLLKDLETISQRIDSLSREFKSKTANDPAHAVLIIMEKAKKLIEQGKWLRDELSDEELEKIVPLQLLSSKKAVYVLNCDESKLGVRPLLGVGPLLGDAIRISAKLESELADLSQDEQEAYLKELGLFEPGLNRLIKKAYETLGLISFFTAGAKEVRAWTLRRGSTALAASGIIHSDFERGFIAAEVIDWRKFVHGGGWQAAKAQGLIKTIGKSEQIQDGYVVEFRFSV